MASVLGLSELCYNPDCTEWSVKSLTIAYTGKIIELSSTYSITWRTFNG